MDIEHRARAVGKSTPSEHLAGRLTLFSPLSRKRKRTQVVIMVKNDTTLDHVRRTTPPTDGRLLCSTFFESSRSSHETPMPPASCSPSTGDETACSKLGVSLRRPRGDVSEDSSFPERGRRR